MAYPFKAGLSNYRAVYDMVLPDVAASSDKKNISRFCKGLDDVHVFSLDRLKNLLKKDRGCLYKSCDALYEGSDGRYYFIEFKDQPSGNVKNDDLKTKALDSLAIAGFTFACSDNFLSTMKKSILIVVSDNPDDKLLATLGESAQSHNSGRRDKYGEMILWGLEKLQDREFFAEVHSWTEDSFRKIFVANLP